MITETSITLRRPPHAYLHVQITSHPSTAVTTTSSTRPSRSPLEEITLLSHLNSALNQYLGLTGAAIPIDVLKIQGSQGWIRTPRDDEAAVVAALSQWSGKGRMTVRVLGRGTWLGGLSNGGGVDEAELWSLES